MCLKRVKGASAPRDETMVSMERNNKGRSKEGDAAELNISTTVWAEDMYIIYVWIKMMIQKLNYSAGGSIYKENKSCDGPGWA
jgi:hypothetical protein